jgi:hypothetical protein
MIRQMSRTAFVGRVTVSLEPVFSDGPRGEYCYISPDSQTSEWRSGTRLRCLCRPAKLTNGVKMVAQVD